MPKIDAAPTTGDRIGNFIRDYIGNCMERYMKSCIGATGRGAWRAALRAELGTASAEPVTAGKSL